MLKTILNKCLNKLKRSPSTKINNQKIKRLLTKLDPNLTNTKKHPGQKKQKRIILKSFLFAMYFYSAIPKISYSSTNMADNVSITKMATERLLPTIETTKNIDTYANIRGGEGYKSTGQGNSIGLPGASGFRPQGVPKKPFPNKNLPPKRQQVQPQCPANLGGSPGGNFGGDPSSNNIRKKSFDNSKPGVGIDHSQAHLKSQKNANRSKLIKLKKFKKRLEECQKIEETLPANQKCFKNGKEIKNLMVAIRDDLPKRLFINREQVDKNQNT